MAKYYDSDAAFMKMMRKYRQTPSGRPFESKICESFIDYFKSRADVSLKQTTGEIDDTRRGTDLIVAGDLRDIAFGLKALRVDITHNFKGKDNMPAVWDATPGDTLKLGGHPLKFGIRVANNTAGFDMPVVVVGIDAGREDVNGMMHELRRYASSKAEYIMLEAGEALAAYTKITDAAYKTYLDGHAEDLGTPDASRLKLNIEGLDKISTRNPTPLFEKGIAAALALSKGLGSRDADAVARSLDKVMTETLKARGYRNLESDAAKARLAEFRRLAAEIEERAEQGALNSPAD